MFKKSALVVGVMAFFLVATLSAPGAFAKKKKLNYFEVSKCKINNVAVALTKPKSKKSTAADISQSASDTRPKIKLVFKKLRNKKRTSTVGMQLDFTPTDTSTDKRSITMNATLTVKVDKKGKKITKSSIKGGTFTYEGTLSDGSDANGGTIEVDKSALKAKKKVCTLDSEVLLSAVESEIGLIGQQAGSYDYTLTLSKTTFKLKKKTLKKINGTLIVTE